MGKFKDRAALAQAHCVAHTAVEERGFGQAGDLALGFTTSQRGCVVNTVQPPLCVVRGGLRRRSSRLPTHKTCATSCSSRTSSQSSSTKPTLLVLPQLQCGLRTAGESAATEHHSHQTSWSCVFPCSSVTPHTHTHTHTHTLYPPLGTYTSSEGIFAIAATIRSLQS